MLYIILDKILLRKHTDPKTTFIWKKYLSHHFFPRRPTEMNHGIGQNCSFEGRLQLHVSKFWYEPFYFWLCPQN